MITGRVSLSHSFFALNVILLLQWVYWVYWEITETENWITDLPFWKYNLCNVFSWLLILSKICLPPGFSSSGKCYHHGRFIISESYVSTCKIYASYEKQQWMNAYLDEVWMDADKHWLLQNDSDFTLYYIIQYIYRFQMLQAYSGKISLL